jgi:peptide deformylase
MAVKEIVRVWNNKGIIKKNLKTLIMPLKEVQFPLSDEDKKLILDLEDTAKVLSCAGIAANQIGYDRNIFIGIIDETENYEIFINPRIIEKSEESVQTAITNKEDFINHIAQKLKDSENPYLQIYEACLSVPGMNMTFNRYDNIKVSYFDENGKYFEKNLNGYGSRVFQHETDHLNGILIVDRSLEFTVLSDYDMSHEGAPKDIENYVKDLIKLLKDTYACKYLDLRSIVPFRNQEWNICKSPVHMHTCKKNELKNFCATYTRNFRSCKYYTDTE